MDEEKYIFLFYVVVCLYWIVFYSFWEEIVIELEVDVNCLFWLLGFGMGCSVESLVLCKFRLFCL